MKRAERVTRGRRVRKVRDKATETTHYLLCPFMTLYALWHPRMKRAEKVTRDRRVRRVKTKGRDNALPFMPFYDALCPLVPENDHLSREIKFLVRVVQMWR